MRPDRRFGGGRPRIAAAWVLAIGSWIGSAPAIGQDWKPDPIDPKGHSADVVALAIASDGRTLASAGSDGQAKVWNVRDDGKLAHRVDLKGHAGKVLALAISVDGRLVATGGADRTVRLWDPMKGECLATLKGGSGAVEAVAISADGKLVASGGLDTSIRLWDVAARSLVRTVDGHTEGIKGLAFSPDGKLLASASRDRSVRLWDVASGEAKALLGHHDLAAWCVAFNADGRMVASGGLDKTARLWQIPGVPLFPPVENPGQPQPGPGVGVAPNPPQAQERALRAEMAGLAVAEFQRQATPAPAPPPAPTQAPPPPTAPQAPGAVVTETRIVQLPGGVLEERQVVVPIAPGQQPPVPQPSQVFPNLPQGGFIEDIRPQPQPNPQPNQIAMWQAGGDVVALAFRPNGMAVVGAVSNLDAPRTTPGGLWNFPIQIGGPNPNPNNPQPWLSPQLIARGHLGPIWAVAIAHPGQMPIFTAGGDASIRGWDQGTNLSRGATLGPLAPGPVEARVMVHMEPVEALAIAPDGKSVVVANGTDRVTLWDATTRTLVGRLREPSGVVRALAISPDGRKLATGGEGKVVSVWDARTARPLDKFKGHAGTITALAFRPDGKILASASMDGSVSLWDLATKKEVATLARHTSGVSCLAFSGDGKMLATGGLDFTVKLWEVPSGRFVDSLGGHKDAVEAIAVSPDGSTVASGDKAGSVKLWDVSSRVERRTIAAFDGPVRALAFAPDGKTLIGGGGQVGTIRRWDVGDGRVVALQKQAHAGPLRALALSANGSVVATGGDDRELKLWDVAAKLAPGPFRTLEGKVAQLAISPDGKVIATWSSDSAVRIWDWPSGRERSDPIPEPDAADVRLEFSPNGKLLALLPIAAINNNNNNNRLVARLWEVDAGRMREGSDVIAKGDRAFALSPDGRSRAIASGKQVDLWGLAMSRQVRTFEGAAGPIACLAFSPDGKTLAAGSDDGSITAWDETVTRKVRATFKPSTKPISAIAYTPDGKTLVEAGGDKVVRLLDAASGEVRLSLRGPNTPITGLSVSPDGGLVATASDGEPTLFVWDSRTGEVVSNPTLPEGSASDPQAAGAGFACLAFTPDGRTLIAGGERGVSTFDMTPGHRPAPIAPSPVASKGGQERATLRGHEKAVRSLIFVQDGKKLVTRSEDHTVKVWDVSGHGEPLTLGGPDVRVRAMIVSPDGKTLAAGLRRPVDKPQTKDARPAEAEAGGPGAPTPAPDPAPAPAEPAIPTPRPVTPGPGSVPPPAPPPSRVVPQSAGLLFLDGPASRPRLDKSEWLYALLIEGVQVPEPQAPAPPPAPAPTQVLPPGPGQAPAPPPAPPTATAPPPAPAQEPAEPAGRAAPAQPQGPGDGPDEKPFDEVKVWDLDTGAVRGTIAGKATRPGHRNDLVPALAYSPDGKTLATASRSGLVKLWDASTLAPKPDPALRDGGIDLLMFTKDGRTLLGANGAGLVTLWDAETGKIRASFTHDGGMNQVVVSPDGKTIATGGPQLPPSGPPAANKPAPTLPASPGSGGYVRLWDAETGKRRAVLPMPGGRAMRLAFAPDGKTLAASTEGPGVTLWDVAGAEPVAELAWPSGSALYLAFSPDGKALATGGEDEILRVWDVPAGTLRGQLAGHAGAIDWIAFSPDGKTIATAGRDATVKLWDLPQAR